MSHECALKLTDLWKTGLLFYLNYKFDLIGASILALAKSMYYYYKQYFLTFADFQISYPLTVVHRKYLGTYTDLFEFR